jgi:DNA-directed RNA polymerase specialized sigma24 family protein
LPELYRRVYVLSELEGASVAEVAALLRLSLPAVQDRLHRAKLLLLRILTLSLEAVTEEPAY